MKLLLKETMVVYNGGQVLLNGWMVYRFIDALVNKGHPFIGDLYTVNSGATFAVWIHYMDKYLEFFDTFFMVLRGRMDQVRRGGKWRTERVLSVCVWIMSCEQCQCQYKRQRRFKVAFRLAQVRKILFRLQSYNILCNHRANLTFLAL